MNNLTILFLKADVAAWGNDLTEPRPGPTLMNIPELTPDPTVFPYITYHYTVLLLNRPSLSLDSRCAEFRAALQTCISAAKAIVPTVDQYHQTGGPLFWPGYMSAVWMSGLVLALAARVKSYSLSRAKSDIRTVLKLLTVMESRWRFSTGEATLFGTSQDMSFQNNASNMSTYFSQIPTTFPDRQRTAQGQMDQYGHTDNFFDMFDGATWGSLIDIVNDAGTGM
ncbi:hypothetical protein CFRS1_v009011 [Colletotrichum fructicola]|nr:hypothetical protein CFRS1_v009011 [Colletotrichum fructicola]